MEILQIAGATLLGVLLVLVLKTRESKLSSLVTIVTVILIIANTVSSLKPFVSFLKKIYTYISDENSIADIMLRLCGIGIITQVVTFICAESGEKSLATVLEIATDVFALLLSLPLIEKIFDTLIETLKAI